jgi:predicted nucleotide-binding protein
MAALGREKVCCIYSKGVEIPSDIHGVAYLPYHQRIDECFQDVMRDLKHAGYSV